MKIGILTFHIAHNFGAFLQCYALQTYMKRLGCEVEVVDYRPKYLTEPYRVGNLSWIMTPNITACTKRFIVFALSYCTRLRKFKRYDKMIHDKLNLVDVGASRYDLLICGSDQIWNRGITGGDYDPLYFLNSRDLVADVKISYAASFGRDGIDVSSPERQLRRYLEALDAISLREYRGVQALRSKIDLPVTHVVDPVLLLSKERWLSFAKLPKSLKPYILIYQVNFDSNLRRIAEMYAEQRGLSVVEITVSVGWRVKRGVFQTKTPDEFVGLIANADCIFTTSFHATAFSIILEKEFYTMNNAHLNDDRCESLLNECGLLGRCFEPSMLSAPNCDAIDYVKVRDKVSVFKDNSEEYLQNFTSKNI